MTKGSAGTDPSATEDSGAQLSRDLSEGVKSSTRSFLGAARQNLSADNLKDPSVAPVIARFLLDDCERLEQEKTEIKGEFKDLARNNAELRNQLSEKLVEISELKAKTKSLTVNELLYFICSAAGAALFPVMLEIEKLQGLHEIGFIGMIVCGVLVGGSIAVRAWAIFK